LKIAYINRKEYGKYFAQRLREYFEVDEFEHYEQCHPENYDCIFIEYIGVDAINASKQKHKNLIIRTHGLEIYQTNCDEVNWENVTLLTMSKAQEDIFKSKFKGRPKFGLLPCTAMPEKFNLRTEKNNKVALLGNITGRKGEDSIPDFLLKYPDKHVYHIGEVCLYGGSVDEYVKWRVKRDGTSDRYHYEGKRDFSDINKWLDDKSYIWLPSIAEGYPRVIMEGMLKGLCPIVRRYNGSQDTFGSNWTYDTLDEIQKIFDSEYTPELYRKWILEKTSFESQLEYIKEIL
jgi:hypothetical protein